MHTTIHPIIVAAAIRWPPTTKHSYGNNALSPATICPVKEIHSFEIVLFVCLNGAGYHTIDFVVVFCNVDLGPKLCDLTFWSGVCF